MTKGFLPISKKDMEERGIKQLDFVYISGDAYVDHPSFGTAIISRILEKNGYTVGIIPQPNWKDDESVTILGEPRLGFLVSSGNMDSMVNHYSVTKKRRKKDFYSPGAVMGKRPDYATTVYSNLVRKMYKDKAIIIGGIEASLRRLAHYDYWSDKMKRSVLLDSGADIISYGMGERSIVEIANALNDGYLIEDINFIKGTVYKTKLRPEIENSIKLPAYDKIISSKELYAKSFYKQYMNTDPFTAKTLIEAYPDNIYVVQNPPQPPLTENEMDQSYALPYMRTYHPSYERQGGIPAIEEVQFSLISNRGCFGACNFCALTFHQGRIIQTRSKESLVDEAKLMANHKDFKGYIHDVGGPTANFRQPACKKQLKYGACSNKQCLFPKPCENMEIDHSDYVALLRQLREIKGVKKVFVRSGIRFDYLINDKDETFFKELVEHHISGQLKVAPEHVSDNVLKYMGKPDNSVYRRFVKRYKELNHTLHKDQYLVPYLMSSHPGSELKDAIKLAEYLRDLGYMPEQVQDFYPTPSTISTCMYYTGLDPRTMKPVYTAKTPHEKAMQRALIQYRDPKNYELVTEALIKANRKDLVGTGEKCLIRPLHGDLRFTAQAKTQKGKATTKGKRNPNSFKPKTEVRGGLTRRADTNRNNRGKKR